MFDQNWKEGDGTDREDKDREDTRTDAEATTGTTQININMGKKDKVERCHGDNEEKFFFF